MDQERAYWAGQEEGGGGGLKSALPCSPLLHNSTCASVKLMLDELT